MWPAWIAQKVVAGHLTYDALSMLAARYRSKCVGADEGSGGVAGSWTLCAGATGVGAVTDSTVFPPQPPTSGMTSATNRTCRIIGRTSQCCLGGKEYIRSEARLHLHSGLGGKGPVEPTYAGFSQVGVQPAPRQFYEITQSRRPGWNRCDSSRSRGVRSWPVLFC
jgi:hypothetical protein